MCGIIGIANKTEAASKQALFGLKALEYRGYDSAGIAFGPEIEVFKTTKSLDMLEQIVSHKTQTMAIAHTRWATHGEICHENTHPIKIQNACIVHNGIFENNNQICAEINYKPNSQTDTEILLAYLIYLCKNDFSNDNILKALAVLKENAKGSFAAAFSFHGNQEIFWIKTGISPLIAAKTEHGYAIASDECAISSNSTIFELPTKTFGKISCENFQIFPDQEIKQHFFQANISLHKPTKDSWLEEEIEQQVQIYAHEHKEFDSHKKEALHNEIKKYDSILLLACGSGYFAASIAAMWFEEEGINAKAEIASEWNCRKSSESKNTLIIFISQSGETADTILALRKAKQMKLNTLAIINKEKSTIAKEADKTIFLHIGQENSVASTKAFTTQLIKLFELAKNKPLPDNISVLAQKILDYDIKPIAKTLADNNNLAQKIMIIGKNTMSIIAQEAALKIKELTYLHVEAYPAGELKHGYIALVDQNTYAIGIAPEHENYYEKCISNIEEIKTRKGKIILLAKENTINAEYFIKMPEIDYEVAPFLYIIALQKLALEMTKIKGFSIDRPRNLAKSITVI